MTHSRQSLAQQGGLAVSRLDGRGFSLRVQPLWHLCLENRTLFRSPFLGSANSSPNITAGANLLGRMPRLKEEFLLAWPLSTTGGDLNPTCLELFGSLVSGGLIAGRRSRRTRNCLLRTAYCLSGPVSVVENLFLFRRSLSCPTTREKYIARIKIPTEIPSCATARPAGYPQPTHNSNRIPTFNCA